MEITGGNMRERMVRILAVVHDYLPGFKAGGPVRSIANLVESLSNEFEFSIVTSDRDRLDGAPYGGVTIGSWNAVGKARVYYLPQQRQSFPTVVRVLSRTPHEVLYLNSFFDPVFTQVPLWARRIGLLPRRPVVIAPRGELSPGSLALKRWKKVPYRVFASATGLYEDLIWQASSDRESEDIRRSMGATAQKIVVAPNPLAVPHGHGLENERLRQPGDPLRIVFLSRVSPMKNLDYALRVLARVRMPVVFTIHGPIYDRSYWRRCQVLITQMPSNVCVQYAGVVPHGEVPRMLGSHDLLFLPTRGENFGHVIFESLSAGTPVLIADTTPWRDLQRSGIGWDLPLDNEQQFADTIDGAAQSGSGGWLPSREKVRRYAHACALNPEILASNRRLFAEALEGITPTVTGPGPTQLTAHP